MATRLLVVDDDSDLNSMLRELFQESGFYADFQADGPGAIARLDIEVYDLLILDVMLPGPNGFAVLRQIRRRWRVPVMMLTARTEPSERVQGFEAGADDYLAKPFYPEELLARIRAILRRSAPGGQNGVAAIESGDLKVLPGTRSAFYRGRPLDLTAMECEILEHLLRSRGKVVSRDELSFHLYNRPASPYDRSIDTHVSRIRRKLCEDRNLILSIRGTGYQLCDVPEAVRS